MTQENLEQRLNSEEQIQEEYRSHFEEGNITKLRGLKNSTGVDPSPEELERQYLSRIERNHLKIVEVYNGIFGEVPRTEGIVSKVQDLYSSCSTRDIGEFRKIKRTTGIEPGESVIQKKYEACVENNWIDEFKKYFSMTKVDPEVSEEVVRNRFRHNLNNLDDIDTLVDFFGVPERKLVQEGYISAFNKGDIDYIEHVNKVTEINPGKNTYLKSEMPVSVFDYLVSDKCILKQPGQEVFGEMVQNKYLDLSSPKSKETLKKREQVFLDFNELVGIDPSEETLKQIFSNNRTIHKVWGIHYNSFARGLMNNYKVVPSDVAEERMSAVGKKVLRDEYRTSKENLGIED